MTDTFLKNSADSKNSLSREKTIWGLTHFRIKAVLIHLALSTAIIGFTCIIALFAWFPYPLFLLDGTWVALLTLAFVDLALGPFITLIISSNKKSVKELFFDFSVVLCIQLAALSFGLLKIYDQRIVALVHIDSEFHMVSAIAVPEKDEEKNVLPTFEKLRYGMLLPEDFSGMLRKEIELTMYDPDKYRVPDLKVIEKAKMPLEFIPKAVLANYGNEVIYKLIVGKKHHGIAVMDNNMQIVNIVLSKQKNARPVN